MLSKVYRPSTYDAPCWNSVKLPIAALANPNEVSNGFAVSLPKLIVPKFVPNTLTDSRFRLWLE